MNNQNKQAVENRKEIIQVKEPPKIHIGRFYASLEKAKVQARLLAHQEKKSVYIIKIRYGSRFFKYEYTLRFEEDVIDRNSINIVYQIEYKGVPAYEILQGK